MPGRCAHVACMHACGSGCPRLCLCVSSEECDNASGVSLLLTRMGDVPGHVGNDRVGRGGCQTQKIQITMQDGRKPPRYGYFL